MRSLGCCVLGGDNTWSMALGVCWTHKASIFWNIYSK
jgi:hypothetical protein